MFHFFLFYLNSVIVNFDSLATRLKNIGEHLNKMNGEVDRINKVKEFCKKLLTNKQIMGSIELEKSQWNKLKGLGFVGKKVGGWGQWATSKFYNKNTKAKPNKK